MEQRSEVQAEQAAGGAEVVAPASESWARPGPLTWAATGLAVAHLLYVVASGRARWEHVAADVLVGLLGWLGPGARRFLPAALPLWAVGVLLDNQRLWLGLRGTIHTGDLWALERRLFPAPGGLIWPEWWLGHTHAALDLLCGLAYAVYLPETFILLVYFFVVRHPRFQRVAFAFFGMNFAAIFIYVLYPAAPPWYVLDHGPGPADLAAAASAAGAARFDALLGTQFFHNFYSRNPNVFGAMPSLHTAYPVAVIWHVWALGWRWRVPAILFASLVGFSAVYLQHHYLLDVVAGAGLAFLVCWVVDVILDRVAARRARAVAVSAA